MSVDGITTWLPGSVTGGVATLVPGVVSVAVPWLGDGVAVLAVTGAGWVGDAKVLAEVARARCF